MPCPGMAEPDVSAIYLFLVETVLVTVRRRKL